MNLRGVAALLLALSFGCVESVALPPPLEGRCQRAEDCAPEQGCVDLQCGVCRSSSDDCATGLECREGRCLPSLADLCLDAGAPCGIVTDPSTGVDVECASQRPCERGQEGEACALLDLCDRLRAGDICHEGACCTSACPALACGRSSCGRACVDGCGPAELLVPQSEPGVPPTDRPVGRTYAAFAVDPATGRGLLFGGKDRSELHLDDTWLLEGDPPRWRRLQPLVSPAGRHGATMVWDAPRARWLMLLGGREWDAGSCERGPDELDPTCVMDDEVWAFGPAEVGAAEPTSWEKLEPVEAGPRLPGRTDSSLAVDPASGDLLLFGGRRYELHQDTWRLWFEPDDPRFHVEQLQPAHAPSPRERASLTSDGASLLLFGGRVEPEPKGRVVAELWRWADGDWTQVESPGGPPTPRAGHAALLLPGLGLVVVGGADSATETSQDQFLDDLIWVRSEESGAWFEVPQGRAIGGRESPVLLPRGGGIVVGLGTDSVGYRDDLWRWIP